MTVTNNVKVIPGRGGRVLVGRIKCGVLAMYKGFSPMVAVEFARRVLPDEVRPSFDETEKLCKSAGKVEQAAAA